MYKDEYPVAAKAFYTKSATLKFQKAYGLVENGVAGPKTIAKAKKVGKNEKH